MKKFVKIVIVLAFMLIFSLTILSACKSGKVEIKTISYNLNGGSFTEEYKEQNGISSNNVVKAVNLNYYGGFADSLADERALIAPSGKVFAGWYLDKNCTPEKYLTSRSWENFSNAIKEGDGNNVIYARWIDDQTKDILYEIDLEDLSFNQDFIAKNIQKNNMNGTSIVRFNISKIDFEIEKNNLPTSQDMVFSVKNEFCGWKVECNGHYYDFKEKNYNANANNKLNSFVNLDFDYTDFSDFWADGNEKVAYVLLRPKALEYKSVNRINISLDNVYINNSEYENLIKSKTDDFSSVPTLSDFSDIDGTLYYSKLTFDVRYDIDFAFIESVLPTTCLKFNNGLEYDGWKIKINGTEYEFTETNWNEYAKVKPSETVREGQFILKTK